LPDGRRAVVKSRKEYVVLVGDYAAPGIKFYVLLEVSWPLGVVFAHRQIVDARFPIIPELIPRALNEFRGMSDELVRTMEEFSFNL
jgi:hypothetical protein